MILELTPEIFNLFCNNILKYQDKVELSGDHPEYIYSAWESLGADVQEIFFIHKRKDQKLILWRRKDWLTSQEKWKKIREDRDAYNSAVEERKSAYREICLGICEMMDLDRDLADSDMVKRIAERVLLKKSKKAEEMLGIDLDSLPELPGTHIILNADGEEDYRV